ncbi:uncharacterized protein LOC134836358 [Culicoides brevitarsis]|uniref:uncharacterized protein LOC134836358 n=1 Tax=Culicoides brevitarsis TaxID=469753 RepID=UPI00307BF8E8
MPSATHLTVPSVDQNGHVLPHSPSSVSLQSQISVSSCNGGMQTPTLNGKKPVISRYRQYAPQILAVSVKNVLLLAYGMTLGIATIVIPAVSDPESEEELYLTKNQTSWFSSINLIFVPFGCIVSGAFTQALGRRRAMQIITFPIFVSWMLFYFAQSVWYLYAALILSGFSGGLMEAPVLTYVAEVTQPAIRGSLSGTGTLCIIIGVTLQFLFGTFWHWRLVSLYSSVVPIFSLFLLFFIPESPYWLISKKQYKQAEESLAWLRGWVTIDRIQREYKQIRDRVSTVTLENPTGYLSRREKLQQFNDRSFVIPFILVSLAFFIGHFSGMTTLQTYAVGIFKTLKAPMDEYQATLLLGVVEVTGGAICICVIHYTGKRPLALISTIGCGICFLGTATYASFLGEIRSLSVSNVVTNVSNLNFDPNFLSVAPLSNHSLANDLLGHHETAAWLANDYIEDVPDMNDTLYDSFMNETHLIESLVTVPTMKVNESSIIEEELNGILNLLTEPKTEENKYAWIPLTLLLGSALLSHSGIRLLPWILIGEVFPPRVRATGAGLASGMGYFFGFLANKVFYNMISTMTLSGTFWFYSGISLLGAMILFWILPETEGRTLLEIEDHFRGKQRLNTKNANITPKKMSTVSRTFQLDVKQWDANREFEKNLQQHNFNPRAVLNSAHKRGDIVVSVPSGTAMGVKKTRTNHAKPIKEEDVEQGLPNLGFEAETTKEKKETTHL